MARIQRTAFQRCIPLNVTFEITLRCNLLCRHCYNFDREQPYAPGRSLNQELSVTEVLRILGELHEEGCLLLAFTGGEALLHPHLDEFVRHAATLGMAVRLKSNGTGLTVGRVARLKTAGVTAVDVSLYGATADVHDAFVRQPGAHARTIAGMRNAREAGLQVQCSIIVTRTNADQLGDMLRLAESLDVNRQINAQLSVRHDGSRSSLDDAAQRDALEQLYRGPLRSFAVAREHSDSVQCACARSNCGITAFGDVYPCIGAPLSGGNLREQSFREIWRDSPTFNWIRGLRLSDFAACRDCTRRAYCRRTSGFMYSNTGDYTGPRRFGDEFACIEADVVGGIAEAAP